MVQGQRNAHVGGACAASPARAHMQAWAQTNAYISSASSANTAFPRSATSLHVMRRQRSACGSQLARATVATWCTATGQAAGGHELQASGHLAPRGCGGVPSTSQCYRQRPHAIACCHLASRRRPHTQLRRRDASHTLLAVSSNFTSTTPIHPRSRNEASHTRADAWPLSNSVTISSVGCMRAYCCNRSDTPSIAEHPQLSAPTSPRHLSRAPA